MRKSITLAALALLVWSPANAVTLKKGMPSCVSEDLFMQMAHAVVDKDMEAISWLADNGCGISAKALHVSVIDTDGALAHVRAYRGKVAAEVWTPVEALDGYDPAKALEPADHGAVADVVGREFVDAVGERVDLVVLGPAGEVLGLGEERLVPRAANDLDVPRLRLGRRG